MNTEEKKIIEQFSGLLLNQLIKIVASGKKLATSKKEMYLAPSHVSRRLFECDKRLELVNHSLVGDR